MFQNIFSLVLTVAGHETSKFLIAIVIGGVMGILTHVQKHGHLKLPKKNKQSLNLGFLTDVCFSAVAALVGVLIADPKETARFVIIAILAGYAGEAFIKQMSTNEIDVREKDEKNK